MQVALGDLERRRRHDALCLMIGDDASYRAFAAGS
jgi:hypothetical protein